MDELSLPETLNAATAYVDANIEAGRGNQIAICHRDREISYAEVLDNVNRTGNALRDLGMGLEDRVALLLLDCPEFVYSFLVPSKLAPLRCR